MSKTTFRSQVLSLCHSRAKRRIPMPLLSPRLFPYIAIVPLPSRARKKGLGVRFPAPFAMLASASLPLQPPIIILHANRIRIPLNVNIAAIALLRLDHSRPITLATLPRREMIAALPLRQRRLALQPPPRTINRRRNENPPNQHNRRTTSEPHRSQNPVILSESCCSEESRRTLRRPASVRHARCARDPSQAQDDTKSAPPLPYNLPTGTKSRIFSSHWVQGSPLPREA